jgi:hypothetical protein
MNHVKSIGGESGLCSIISPCTYYTSFLFELQFSHSRKCCTILADIFDLFLELRVYITATTCASTLWEK